jgi:hypothetical protein
MRSLKGTSFDDRLSAAANAKKAELEKFRARSGVNDPAFAERQAARHAIDVARDARTAERKASRLASVAHAATEKAAQDAAAEAEQAASDAEVAGQAAHDIALQAERKATRDARYALERRGLENDSAPFGRFGDRPATPRSMSGREKAALEYTIVKNGRR